MEQHSESRQMNGKARERTMHKSKKVTAIAVTSTRGGLKSSWHGEHWMLEASTPVNL